MLKKVTVDVLSCGGVVFRKRDRVFEIALIRTGRGRNWKLPKGRMEEGESFEETALREITEETGLTGKIVSPIDTICYTYRRRYRDGSSKRIDKAVHNFLVAYVAGEIRPEYEGELASWVSFDSAETLLQHDHDREIVSKARALLTLNE